MSKTRVRRMGDVVVGGRRRIASTVYGTVVVMAALVASAGDHTGWDLTATVASVSVAIWIAHVYAYELGQSIEREHRPSLVELREIAAKQLPILSAALLPTLFLALGAAGVLHENRAIWAALAVGLATLAVQGARYARVEALGALGTTAAIAANLMLGSIVIAIKVFVGE